MSYKDNTEAKISGDFEEQERRKDILDEIVSAFEQGDKDAVKSRLMERVKEIEDTFQTKLNELRNSL